MGVTFAPAGTQVILKRDGVKCSIKSLTALARAAFDLRAQEVSGSVTQQLMIHSNTYACLHSFTLDWSMHAGSTAGNVY
jgi:hypothetical protein